MRWVIPQTLVVKVWSNPLVRSPAHLDHWGQRLRAAQIASQPRTNARTARKKRAVSIPGKRHKVAKPPIVCRHCRQRCARQDPPTFDLWTSSYRVPPKPIPATKVLSDYDPDEAYDKKSFYPTSVAKRYYTWTVTGRSKSIQPRAPLHGYPKARSPSQESKHTRSATAFSH